MRSTISIFVLLAACSGASSPDAGAPLDASRIDAASLDATSLDASTLDATDDDASTIDAGAGDATATVDACTPAGAQLEPWLDGLLFTSESDYPIELASFPGEGADTPTPADVARLASAPAGATTEVRDLDWFFAHVVVDPTRTPPVPDTRPEELRAALESSLSDVIVVRIVDPASPAEIAVYAAGRDACGALVWLTSTSIET